MHRICALPLLAASLLGCAGAASPAKQVIAPPGATRLAPYSTAVRYGDVVFLSGVIGTRPGTRELVTGGIGPETRQALENVRANLAAAGLQPADVLKCTVFLASMGEYEAMNAVYGEFFRDSPPARSAVAVAGLPLNARVEIECIAGAK